MWPENKPSKIIRHRDLLEAATIGDGFVEIDLPPLAVRGCRRGMTVAANGIILAFMIITTLLPPQCKFAV